MAVYECLICHETTEERISCCPRCHAFDTMIDKREDDLPDTPLAKRRRAVRASTLSLPPAVFVTTGSAEWDHVLGGGFVRPSSVLVQGTAGIGKSSAAIAIACAVGRSHGSALYGSAEMPGSVVRLIAERRGLASAALSKLWVEDSNDAADLLEDIAELRPAIVVWDSIQRFRWEGEDGETALRQVVRHAIDAGKEIGAVTLLLSQVTKEGDFLGPNGIGHDVDVMIELMKDGGETIVRCSEKNRFATTPREATLSFSRPETSRPI